MAAEKHTSRFPYFPDDVLGPINSPHNSVEKPVHISMHKVYFYAHALAKKRGFPAPALDEIAFRIVWLEQRGLPGLTYFAAECMRYDHMALQDRGQLIFEPTLTLRCPIYSGTLIKDVFPELIAGFEDDIRVMRGPTNAFLILPKLAQYAADLDVAMTVNWTTEGCSEVAARTMVYDHQIIHDGNIQDIVDADGVGICQYTGSTEEVFQGPDVDSAYISPVTMLKLIAYCGRERASISSIKSGPSDIEKMIDHDNRLAELFAQLRPRDISLIGGYARSKTGTEMSTRLNSPNDKLWSHLAAIGWLKTIDASGLGLKSFALTAMGQAAIPVMLGKFLRPAA